MAKAKKRTFKTISEQIDAKADEIIAIQNSSRDEIVKIKVEIQALESERADLKIECECAILTNVGDGKVQCKNKDCGRIFKII